MKTHTLTSTEKDARIAELESKIASLESQLDWFRKQIFGKKSEKHLPLDPETLQLSLFGDSLSEQERQDLDAEVAKEQEKTTKTITVSKTERTSRKPIDTTHLPVEEEHIYPQGIHAQEYTELAPEITERLELQPARMIIRRTIRHKYVLKSHLQITSPEREPFAIAPLPAAPLHKCMAGASVLADLVIDKFFYHLPFYRVIQKYKELGVVISDSTMGDWFAATCEKLKLLYDRLREEVLSQEYIQVDESTLPVIDNEKHRAVKGYIWVVRDAIRGDIFFHYDFGSRSERTAMRLLKDYKGAIQTDGYNVYDKFEGLEGKLMLGCWAHARRKFTDALEENSKLATEALIYIGKLYRIESLADEQSLSPEARVAKRKREAYPLIIEFEKWMNDTYTKVLSSSRMGKAIGYTYSLLPRLSRYVTDSRYLLDNNLVENVIRPLAIGRKNYLFCGNDASACRAAIVYSLIGSCKAAGVEPREWLEDVLKKMPEYELGKKDIVQLLPRNWKQIATIANK